MAVTIRTSRNRQYAEAVWEYVTRTEASGTPGTAVTFPELVAAAVWASADRIEVHGRSPVALCGGSAEVTVVYSPRLLEVATGPVYAGLGEGSTSTYNDTVRGTATAITGAATWTTRPGHGERQFFSTTGSGQYANVGAITSSSTWTVAAWVSPASYSTGNINYPVGFVGAAGLYTGYKVAGGSAVENDWGFSDGSQVIPALDPLTLGQTHLLIVERVGTTYTIWRDGEQKGTGTRAAVALSAVNVGRRADNAWFHNGSVGDVVVWDRVLTTEERAALASPGYRLNTPVACGGEAVEWVENGIPETFSETVSGGIRGGGGAPTIQVRYFPTRSGGATLGSTATVTATGIRLYAETMIGGAALGGEVSVSVVYNPYRVATPHFSQYAAQFDAANASTVTESGGLVSAWRNTVTGVTATQATGSLQPTYTSGVGLTFDDADDCLELSVSSKFVFVALNRSVYESLGSTVGHTGDIGLRLDSTNNRRYRQATSADWTDTTGRIWINGVEGNQFAAYGVPHVVAAERLSAQTINRIGNYLLTRGLTGTVHEVILSAASLTDDEIRDINLYLFHKWVLSDSVRTGSTMGGVAVESVETAPTGNTYNETMSGGAVAGSSATVATRQTPTVTGGAQAGSAATNTVRRNITPTGGARLAGAALQTFRDIVVMTGGSTLGGTARVTLSDRVEVSGGATCGGTALVSRRVSVTPTGGATCGGSAETYKLVVVTMSGGAQVAGLVIISVVDRPPVVLSFGIIAYPRLGGSVTARPRLGYQIASFPRLGGRVTTVGG